MRISVSRGGGLGQARRSATVDDVQLPLELQPAVQQLALIARAQAGSRPGPVLRSQPHYAVTIADEFGPQLVTLYESQMPRAVLDLLEEILRYPGQAADGPGSGPSCC